jgi:hypothetical protein
MTRKEEEDKHCSWGCRFRGLGLGGVSGTGQGSYVMVCFCFGTEDLGWTDSTSTSYVSVSGLSSRAWSLGILTKVCSFLRSYRQILHLWYFKISCCSFHPHSFFHMTFSIPSWKSQILYVFKRVRHTKIDIWQISHSDLQFLFETFFDVIYGYLRNIPGN